MGYGTNKETYQPALEIARTAESHLSILFEKYLRRPGPNSVVCCVPAGDCLELVYLRDFVGDEARIFAFDIQDVNESSGITNSNKLWIVATNSNFAIRDIRRLNNLLHAMPKNPPELVICRHPQVIEQIDTMGNVLKQNLWWCEPLATLASRVARNHGQMLVTCYLKLERDMIAETMRKKKINPVVGENSLSPQNEWEIAGPYVKKRDGFTIVVKG